MLHFTKGRKELQNPRHFGENQVQGATPCLMEPGESSWKAANAGWVLAWRKHGWQGLMGSLAGSPWAGELGPRDSTWAGPGPGLCFRKSSLVAVCRL